MYCHSARLHCAFGCAAHTQGVMDSWGADVQHRITTLSTCECRWMALTYVYLIERAPRCLCYAIASLRPRPADGANRAMHTVGGHMRLKIKQGQGGMLPATT